MTAYAINKVCWRAARDDAFRLALRAEPEHALSSFTPTLSPEEVNAFLTGDVAHLCAMGAHRFLLQTIPRLGLFGLDRTTYVARLRAAYDANPAGRPDISR